MNKLLKFKWYIAAGVILFIGLCVLAAPSPKPAKAEAPKPAQPHVVMEVLVPSLQVYAPMWQVEINRRFDNAVGVLVHGGDFVRGQWIVGWGMGDHVTPVEQVVDQIHAQYPGRTVVLLACNTGHLAIHNRPWLYYFSNSVWCVPDRAVSPAMLRADVLAQLHFDTLSDNRYEIDPDANGNIFEAIRAD